MGRRPKEDRKVRFDQRLVLANWMLDLFGVPTFERLADYIKSPQHEGLSDDGVTRFHQELKLLYNRPELPDDLLLAYDGNIVRHWRAITERRNATAITLNLRYFQYLCLLFTEIYLDRFFRDPAKLLAALSNYREQFNAEQTPQQPAAGLLGGLPAGATIPPFEPDDLRKLAFWSATGSGKTLLMHINIRQYMHYLELHRRDGELRGVILLTPNEGLSRQHLDEFKLSGMKAELFEKDGPGLFGGTGIAIIHVQKLQEASGNTTVAVESFEGNNLVLVDEGHRGTSGKEEGRWLQMREKLCSQGFSFEYSATFGQAVKASGNEKLTDLYAKCILFDYSYRYFYKDGYGKEYSILNMRDVRDEEHRRRYLTACLLTFFQQQRIFGDRRADAHRFMIERPLWIFVGGSVTKSPSKKDISDVVDILLFLSRFVQARTESTEYLESLLTGHSGLRNDKGQDIFTGAFGYLVRKGFSGHTAYSAILETLFGASAPGMLHVRRLKSGGESEGEVALHVGDANDPFGLINVGDPKGLCDLCEKNPQALAVSDSEFSESLFRKVNADASPINILIGSKKFSEGWSSWRVSTMGLMNIGKSEGAQIIQLFGRGVRLKGLDFCLKRSKKVLGTAAPADIDKLETLNVFGVKADYMQQFKEYLEEEGLPTNEDKMEVVLPVFKNLGRTGLKTVRLKEGTDFKKQGKRPTLGPAIPQVVKDQVVLDWYPRLQAMASQRGHAAPVTMVPEVCHFSNEQVALLDIDRLYFDLQQMKSERAWYNLNLSREGIRALLLDTRWYELRIPSREMRPRTFEQIARWQEIAKALLRRYCDRFYKLCKAEFESEHLEYRELTEDDPNFQTEYRFMVEKSAEEIKDWLEKLKARLEKGELQTLEFRGISALMFSNHLYHPLIYVNNDHVEVRPVPLNEGERDFVLDLRKFCEGNKPYFEGKELYLLRNMSRGKGVAFFEAGNFHPDFILWLLAEGRQFITFVDPKGLRNLQGLGDPKIRFCHTIKQIEDRMRVQDPKVTLNSFIISNTRHQEVGWWAPDLTREGYREHHVLFQQEDKNTYIATMLKMVLVDRLGQ